MSVDTVTAVACRRIGWRSAVIFGAIFANILATGAAQAISAGCAAVNGGSWLISDSGSPSGTSQNGVFNAGDQLSFVFSGAGIHNYSFTGSLLPGGTASNSSANFTVIAGGAGGVTLQAFTGTFSIASASCTAGPASLAPTITFVPSPNPSVAGQSVGFTLTVSGGSGTPTGTYSIDFGDGSSFATGTLVGGQATVNHVYLTANTFHPSATYNGDSTYLSGTLGATQLVAPAPGASAIAFTAAPNPSIAGQTVNFSLTVTGTGTPTGGYTVDFGDGSPTSSGALAGGHASLSHTYAANGIYTVTASYAGDSSNAAGTTTLIQSVGMTASSVQIRTMQIQATQQASQIAGQMTTGAVDVAIDTGFGGNVAPLTPNGSGVTFNFAAGDDMSGQDATADRLRDFINAPDKEAKRIDDAFSALGYSGKPAAKRPSRMTAKEIEWLGWIDVRGMSVSTHGIANDLKGDQIAATGGITRKLTPDFLIGAFGGIDHFDFTSDALASRLKGDGWTAGVYLGWRFLPTMRFDLSVSRSGINFKSAGGAATATFPGNRWMVSSGLTGTYNVKGLVLQPSAHVYANWEHESGFTDSLGVVQPSRDFSSGRASGGAKLSYPIAVNDVVYSPNVGAYGDYYFMSDNGAGNGLASTPLLQGWSARAAGGVDMRFMNRGTLSFSGELGGIGGNTTIWTYRARGTLPF